MGLTFRQPYGILKIVKEREMVRMIAYHMESYKNRQISEDYPSEVYFNLHKECFSMVQDGLVVLHSDMVVLEDVWFKVSEAGRQRVLSEQRKNVHARVYGMFKGTEADSLEGFREAYYNPYKVSTFVDYLTGEPIHKASEVILIAKTIYYKK
jgi:hypothetical protein